MTKTSLSKKLLFGVVAMSMGYATREQVNECIDIQRQSEVKRRLGDIMRQRGYLTEVQVKEILSVQGRKEETTSVPDTPSGRRRFIGEILIERGYIDRQTLNNALKRQMLLRDTGLNPKLGEILISFGKITAGQLKEALDFQLATA